MYPAVGECWLNVVRTLDQRLRRSANVDCGQVAQHSDTGLQLEEGSFVIADFTTDSHVLKHPSVFLFVDKVTLLICLIIMRFGRLPSTQFFCIVVQWQSRWWSCQIIRMFKNGLLLFGLILISDFLLTFYCAFPGCIVCAH